MEGCDSDERPTSGTPPTKRSLARRIGPIRAWFHSRPGGQTLFRTLVALTGLVLVTLGLALVPLPGPGWLIVLGGIAVWAIEFVWARHLLRFTTEQLRRWTDWQRGQHWLVRMAILLMLATVAIAVLWLSIKHGLRFEWIKGALGAGVGAGVGAGLRGPTVGSDRGQRDTAERAGAGPEATPPAPGDTRVPRECGGPEGSGTVVPRPGD